MMVYRLVGRKMKVDRLDSQSEFQKERETEPVIRLVPLLEELNLTCI